jgi:hypothetical protein
MTKFIINIFLSILLLAVVALATFNKTVEGLTGFKADDLDVIYHTDETKDYNKLISEVMTNNEVITAFNGFDEIKDKIKADPTILDDLKGRLASYITMYKTDPVKMDPIKSGKLDILISKLQTVVNSSDFIIDKGPVSSTMVKDFRKLLGFVNNDPVIKSIFDSNHTMLDQIYSKIQNNPAILENLALRLKPEIDAINKIGATDADKAANKAITDDLLANIAKLVSARKNDYMVKLNITDKIGTVTYNEPGYFRFGPSSYVPNYEDSVYLSRLTNIDWKTPVVDLASTTGISGARLGGFCSFNKTNPTQTELECNKLDKNTCASTSCCALLGGEKCVAGNESGPTMKSNFSDIYIRNKDHYYHQGKCYGNCPDK